MNTEKVMVYTAELEQIINEVIDENSDSYMDDISENFEEFLTALCVTMPHQFLKRFTEEQIRNFLDSNHVANSLCVQFLQAMKEQHQKG